MLHSRLTLRIDIKPSKLEDTGSGRVRRNGRNIEDANSISIIALVGVVPNHVLIVVIAGARGLVVSGLFWCFERRDVPFSCHVVSDVFCFKEEKWKGGRTDVGHGSAGSSGTSSVYLVVFVVEDDEFLPFLVQDLLILCVRSCLVYGNVLKFGLRDRIEAELLTHP